MSLSLSCQLAHNNDRDPPLWQLGLWLLTSSLSPRSYSLLPSYWLFSIFTRCKNIPHGTTVSIRLCWGWTQGSMHATQAPSPSPSEWHLSHQGSNLHPHPPALWLPISSFKACWSSALPYSHPLYFVQTSQAFFQEAGFTQWVNKY